MVELLSNDDIQDKLKKAPLWQQQDNQIVRELVASNFAAAVGIVNSIAVVAEKLDHHPDILLYGWNKVRVSTTTHSAGGLTENDFELAYGIDALNF